MGSNPINLAFRFLLELMILLALGVWGWQKGDGLLRIVPAIGAPLIAAVLWGTFRVPNDPGRAPVAVPGVLRLVLELALFGVSVWALADIGAITWSWILGIAVAIHYVISYDRIAWLIKQ